MCLCGSLYQIRSGTDIKIHVFYSLFRFEMIMKNHGILALLRVSLYTSNMCIRLVESIWDEEIDKDQFNKNHNISKWNRVISGIAYFV